MSGWIKIHRRIRDNHLWPKKRAFTRLEAWLDLLLAANHSPVKRRYKLKIYTVRRGQVPTSILSISKRWKWSHGKVGRFLKMLKNDSMIDTNTESGFTLVSICNYETYQIAKNTDGERTENERKTNGERTGDTIRMLKNVKEGGRRDAALNLEEFEQKFPEVEVVNEYKKFKTYNEARGLIIANESAAFTNWLSKPWVAKKAAPKEIWLYCPQDHMKIKASPKTRVMCRKCRERMEPRAEA